MITRSGTLTPDGTPRTGAQILCEALVRQGVEVIFGIPGGAIMPFYHALPEYADRLRHVLCRHEQGAGHAAEGYARASGRVGVCVATSGPGATNLVTPIADAWMDSTPLVAITGQVRASLIFAKEGGRWVIKDEGDAPSDARRMRAAQNMDGCESVVQQLASSTPEAMRVLGGQTDPANGHLSNGTRLGGGPPETPYYSVAIHENHTDRIVTMMWIDVDPKTGATTDAITNAPLKGSPDLVEKVKVACASASR